MDTSESLSFPGNSNPGVGVAESEFTEQQNPKKILKTIIKILLLDNEPSRVGTSRAWRFRCPLFTAHFYRKAVSENQTADLSNNGREGTPCHTRRENRVSIPDVRS